MNDMLDQPLSDDDVIARLRSALDEVAATAAPGTAGSDTAHTPSGDDHGAAVITLRTGTSGRRPTRTWLGVAAVSAALLGGAGWVLTQRTSPAATGQSTTLAPASTATGAGAAARPEGHTGPWYELRLADAVAGSIESGGTDNSPSGFTQQWMIASPDGVPGSFGVLSVLVRYDDTGLDVTADTGLFRQIAAPQGTAWLQNDLGNPSSVSPAMVWKRDDNTVWWVQQANLVDAADADGTAFADYVFAVERGTFNDLLNNPDTRAEWIGTAPANLRVEHTQAYAVGGVDTAIALGVATSLPLERLIGTTDITEVTVAGNRAWRGTQADGETTVVWGIDSSTIPATSTTPQQWWGILRISPALGDRVDEVIESVTPVAPPSEISTTDPGEPIATTTPPIDQASGSKPADAPSYVLDDPAFTPAGTNGQSDAAAGDIRSAVWTVDQADLAAAPAYVFATAMDWGGMPYEADGVNYLDVSRNGVAAVLDVGADSSGDRTLPPKVYLPQADGVVWVFTAVGLEATGDDPFAPLVDLAFALGNEAFVSGADPAAVDSITLLGSGALPATEYFDTYTLPTGDTVSLIVADGIALGALRDATAVTATTVLDRPALVGTLIGGSTQVVWQATDGSRWWASLTFPASTDPALIDQAIAALRPA